MFRKGQVWIETVLYTLIGLALIGVVLAIITPKINELQDRKTIEQSKQALDVIDEKINEVLERGPGNSRIINQFSLKKGELHINSSSEEIVFFLGYLEKPYSEIGLVIPDGRIKILSEKNKNVNSVRLFLDYKNITNVTYKGQEIYKKFSSSSVPYRFLIKNTGNVNANGNYEVYIDEISGG